jgi:hypothetical protein
MGRRDDHAPHSSQAPTDFEPAVNVCVGEFVQHPVNVGRACTGKLRDLYHG